MASNNLSHTMELDGSFRLILERYRNEWTDLRVRNRPTPRAEIKAAVESIYLESDQEKPAVVWCDSIFQMAALPLVLALYLDDVARQHIIPVLRNDLNTPPWIALFRSLDSQLPEPVIIESLARHSKKETQQDSLREVNRFIRRVHETVGGTFDTTEAPRLSAIGLQINSKYVAEVQGLIARLDRELTDIVSADCVSPIKTELSTIAAVFARLETQLGLQIIPQALAQTVWQMRDTLLSRHGAITRELERRPGRLTDLIKLIYQANPGLSGTMNNQVPPWEGARIGAYRDPAVRLIASSLQIDVFKQSSVLGWLPLHFYMSSTMKDLYSPDLTRKLELWNGILHGAYAALFYDGVCFLCDQPSTVSLDNERRYHGEDGPAMTFPDGYSVYAWHGRSVPRDIIDHPENISVERIEKERNVEIRTILMERYGLERFIADSGARVIGEDECGILYRKEFAVEEPLCVVMVKNSTAEPDGTFKNYFLRVPPDIITPRAAVAWTFGLSTDDYLPVIET